MHSLVQEIAKRMNLPPEQAEEVISSILIRVRAALDTIGEAEIQGLGTFRSVDGRVTFEAAPEFANQINQEFSDMKPVALTPTGESVELDDSRALPGVEVVAGDGADVSEDTTEPAERQVSEAQPAMRETATESEQVFGDENDYTFKSPPPPKASKFRGPSGERRSSHRRTPTSHAADEIPDMGSIVSTRPVQPIHTAGQKRRKSRAPLLIAIGVVVVGVGTWLIFGGGGEEPDIDQHVMETSGTTGSQRPAAEAVSARASQAEPSAPEAPDMAAEENQGSGHEATGMETDAAPAETASEPAAEQETEVGAKSIEEISKPVEPAAEAAEEVPSEPVAVQPEAAKSETSTPETASSPPAMPSGSVYAWIVASYPSRSEAENRSEKLRGAGLEAIVYEATVRGQPAFRVGIGTYGSEADALNNHDIVPPEAPDAWITRVN
ncbi:MAG: SPOR domain-containing protein [Rhodothermales bacterium]